jgi:hypothetical protein
MSQQAKVTISSKAPHYSADAVLNEKGKVITPAVYAGLMVSASIEIGDTSRSGPHFVDLPATATDSAIEAALLAQYGVA